MNGNDWVILGIVLIIAAMVLLIICIVLENIKLRSLHRQYQSLQTTKDV